MTPLCGQVWDYSEQHIEQWRKLFAGADVAFRFVPFAWFPAPQVCRAVLALPRPLRGPCVMPARTLSRLTQVLRTASYPPELPRLTGTCRERL